MKAVERLQKTVAEREAEHVEALVNDTVSDVGLGHFRYMQGLIAGLRMVRQDIEDMRKRYNEDDDADS